MKRRDFLALAAASFSTSLLAESFSLEDVLNKKSSSNANLVNKRVSDLKKYFIPKVKVKNEVLQNAIRKIAEPLFLTSNLNVNWEIVIINDKRFDACTFGSGLIVLNKKFLKMCDNEIQLAAVIAHEIGHNHYKHIEKDLDIQKIYKDFDVTNIKNDNLLRLSMSYSRMKERQADAFIIKAFLETDYPIKDASSIFKKFEELYPSKSFDINKCIYSTHPQHKDRIRKLESVASTFTQINYNNHNSNEFNYIKNWSKS